jgi:hypothetical protein
MFHASPDTSAYSKTLAALTENDIINKLVDDTAALITGLVRKNVVKWSATNSRWELCDGTAAAAATDIIGIVEYVGSPDTSGQVRIAGVFTDDTLVANTAYYCQADGTLGTTETITFMGYCTASGRLCMLSRGSGSGGGGAPGLTNYIVPNADGSFGRKFTVGADLNLTISAGETFISNVKQTRAQNTVALTARRAQLVYDTKAGASGVLLAAPPAADAGTVCRFIIDGSATIASSVGAITLNKSGTVTAVPGLAADNAGQFDGVSGTYISTSFTGIPTGDNIVAIVDVYTYNGPTATWQNLVGIGTAAGMFGTAVAADGTLNVFAAAGAQYSTGFVFETGKTYYTEVAHDGINCRVYVNGSFVWQYAGDWQNTTAAGTLRIGSWYAGTQFDKGTHHYVEIRNALRSPAQIAAISNALLLPCRYYADPAKPEFTDIRSILPADSIPLGYARCDSAHPWEYDDSSYKFGRREGAIGGNRKAVTTVYVTSSASLVYLANSFGTDKVKIEKFFRKNLSDTRKSKVSDVIISGGVGIGALKEINSQQIILNQNASYIVIAANSYTGSQESAGYVDVEMEVIE